MTRSLRAAVGQRSPTEATSPLGTDHDANTSVEERIATSLRQAQSGEEAAVAHFLKVIRPPVRRTCMSVLGPQHPDLDDTIQESMFTALKAVTQFRFDGSALHYVMKIAFRRAFAARRQRQTLWRRHDSLDTDNPPPVSAVESGWSPDDVVLVQRILEDLPAAQSEALLMRIVLGFSVEEIGKMTEVSPNTVKTRLRLAKNALRSAQRAPFWKRWFSEKGE